jgi:hypothetical protein
VYPYSTPLFVSTFDVWQRSSRKREKKVSRSRLRRGRSREEFVAYEQISGGKVDWIKFRFSNFDHPARGLWSRLEHTFETQYRVQLLTFWASIVLFFFLPWWCFGEWGLSPSSVVLSAEPSRVGFYLRTETHSSLWSVRSKWNHPMDNVQKVSNVYTYHRHKLLGIIGYFALQTLNNWKEHV